MKTKSLVNFSGERALARSLPFSVTFTFTPTALRSVTLHQGHPWEVSIEGEDRFTPQLINWLEGYAAGKHLPLPFPLELQFLTPFTRNVLALLGKVPFGVWETYKGIALQCGGAGYARAVGQVCHRNPFPILIPCHRILASGGKMGGFAYGAEVKGSLIQFEEESRG